MSSDREEWIRRAQAEHARRRVLTAVLTVLALGAVVFAGLWISRMPSVRAAVSGDRTAEAAEAGPELAETAPDEAAPAAPPRRLERVGTARRPAAGGGERVFSYPETWRPDPAMAAGGEAAAARPPASDRVPFGGPVVELGMTMAEPGRSHPARLANREEVSRMLREHYPPHLRHGGYGGTVVVSVLVDESGRPRDARVARASGIPELNAAALRVAGGMRFTPEQHLGRVVAVRVEVPLAFSP
jgi:periplasmic protein TonB